MPVQTTEAVALRQIAEKAYLYAYPLVLLDETMRALPANHLMHVSAFPDASFRFIIRPNADTLYTNAWIDISTEPMLLHVPDAGGRFYLLQFMDAWTATFADPGSLSLSNSRVSCSSPGNGNQSAGGDGMPG